jgi:hypothetical protein
MTRTLLAATCVAVAIVGCGSSTTSSSGGGGASAGGSTSAPAGSSSSSSAPASTSTGGGGGGSLTVTGSLSLTLQQTPNTAAKCNSGAGTTVSAILPFDNYFLQFSIPIGTIVFPAGYGKGGVAFYNGNDSSQEWSIGTNLSKGTTGTVTLSSDAKMGTVDIDMLPEPPRPNPSLAPIHVKGTFVCP